MAELVSRRKLAYSDYIEGLFLEDEYCRELAAGSANSKNIDKRVFGAVCLINSSNLEIMPQIFKEHQIPAEAFVNVLYTLRDTFFRAICLSHRRGFGPTECCFYLDISFLVNWSKAVKSKMTFKTEWFSNIYFHVKDDMEETREPDLIIKFGLYYSQGEQHLEEHLKYHVFIEEVKVQNKGVINCYVYDSENQIEWVKFSQSMNNKSVYKEHLCNIEKLIKRALNPQTQQQTHSGSSSAQDTGQTSKESADITISKGDSEEVGGASKEEDDTGQQADDACKSESEGWKLHDTLFGGILESFGSGMSKVKKKCKSFLKYRSHAYLGPDSSIKAQDTDVRLQELDTELDVAKEREQDPYTTSPHSAVDIESISLDVVPEDTITHSAVETVAVDIESISLDVAPEDTITHSAVETVAVDIEPRSSGVAPEDTITHSAVETVAVDIEPRSLDNTAPEGVGAATQIQVMTGSQELETDIANKP